ncbi:MAG TPA: aminotransferase class V-fold PLP-dependent enzyme, partial [Bryobacteraceae bacterium]|nr:aminotransferase class V-fold PLP-dependent enzyme [Bryobacteraceae bacterium]
MPDWKAVRQEFPALENWTYLNTATYGQTPRCAVAAATGHFERRNREACSDFLSWFDDMDQVRADVGRLINAQASDIAFAPNAATALSWLLGGLDWQPGDRVVTLRGEFPNNIYAPASLHARDVEFIEADWNELRGAVEGGRTRLVLAS